MEVVPNLRPFGGAILFQLSMALFRLVMFGDAVGSFVEMMIWFTVKQHPAIEKHSKSTGSNDQC